MLISTHSSSKWHKVMKILGKAGVEGDPFVTPSINFDRCLRHQIWFFFVANSNKTFRTEQNIADKIGRVSNLPRQI